MVQQEFSSPVIRTLGLGNVADLMVNLLSYLLEIVFGHSGGPSAQGRIKLKMLSWRDSQVWQIPEIADYSHGSTWIPGFHPESF